MVNTRNWWLGKNVLLSPRWANLISREENRVFVDLSRQRIMDSPEWDATACIDREYETQPHDHYARPIYWTSDAKAEVVPKL